MAPGVEFLVPRVRAPSRSREGGSGPRHRNLLIGLSHRGILFSFFFAFVFVCFRQEAAAENDRPWRRPFRAGGLWRSMQRHRHFFLPLGILCVRTKAGSLQRHRVFPWPTAGGHDVSGALLPLGQSEEPATTVAGSLATLEIDQGTYRGSYHSKGL